MTGTRAEYGILKPVMKAIQAERALRLQVVVTGMHLAAEFGRSARLVESDGFSISARVPMHAKDDSSAGMARGVGRGVIGMTRALTKLAPDVVLVLGDRTEALATTIAAAYLNIPVAHVHGGDKTEGGGLDESARHAITKFAHLHFTATEQSRLRVLRLGEDPRRVYLSGSPSLDAILSERLMSRSELERALGFALSPRYLVLVQHPVSTDPDSAGPHMRETMDAVEALGLQTIAIYPNSDAGGRAIARELEKRRGVPGFHLFKNLPRERYLALLSGAAALVGNSSSGMIDAASFKVPVVNVGDRQRGRERGRNVLDCAPRKAAISSALRRALFDRGFRRTLAGSRSPYGRGRAGVFIARTLSRVSLNGGLLQKRLDY